MLEVDSVNFSYQKEKVVKNISFRIDSGESCSIIGPSGCGKTTLLYLLAGLMPVKEGTIKINDNKLVGIRPKSGVILQNYGLFPWKNVYHNIELGLLARHTDRKMIEQKVKAVSSRLNIEDHLEKFPIELSGGQRQRVAIARTLVLSPDLLLMDEPFSALDTLTREEMQNLILRIHNRDNLSFVIVTHNIEEAVFLGQKIAIMKNGKFTHWLDNPYFGEPDLRNREEFFKISRQLRRLMAEDDLL